MAVSLSASVLKGSCSAIDEATPLHVFGFVMRQLLDGLRLRRGSWFTPRASLRQAPAARRPLARVPRRVRRRAGRRRRPARPRSVPRAVEPARRQARAHRLAAAWAARFARLARSGGGWGAALVARPPERRRRHPPPFWPCPGRVHHASETYVPRRRRRGRRAERRRARDPRHCVGGAVAVGALSARQRRRGEAHAPPLRPPRPRHVRHAPHRKLARRAAAREAALARWGSSVHVFRRALERTRIQL